ncbi:cyclin-dependent protein kinase inhibitor SMR1-like [Melia azedarach]|uniref:Cyclin-dependent protein kinase inhibitor SMR1-like n=1 Tax=Melia azedarach TaxID=155640 RepID=A0ACC1YBV1_MELAZ|nr:cyclin-dependent protein kinase inhibitor SMR1-like [Melia azedarach]
MPTDLDKLTNDLPKIKVSAIRVRSQEANNAAAPMSSDDRDCDQLECRTPTGDENKIPAVLACPPAPRKPKTRRVSCKRKLFGELKFFDIINRDEVDAFLRSGFELAGNSAMVVKRCKCI